MWNLSALATVAIAGSFLGAISAGCSSSSSSSKSTTDGGGGGSSSGGGSGGGSGSSSGGGSCADAGATCTLSMPVSGGLSMSLGNPGECGTNGGYVLGLDSGQVLFTFSGTFPDQTGTFPGAVSLTGFGDAGNESWQTPDGACSITITQAVCVVFTTNPPMNVTEVTGYGTCSKPAAPTMGTSAPPVTIGKFTFTNF
jgi:hypothetical protein